ncbi:hypothetical protein O6H91_11G115800 [Diphasiastrum complanatum]|uniref:Uncharacterized protein n=1 Tax=Diphasiastrum complanatum TaxID=34168 RepID=A0ACC2CD32_DIPCM|nr:hypothetical protein O6H91_11G115800 [Diphasiastrum complanatum]
MATLFQSAASPLLHRSSSSCCSWLSASGGGHLKLKGEDAVRRHGRLVVKAEDERNGSAAGEVVAKPRKASPLQRGGTLSGEEAEGKDPSPAALLANKKPLMSLGGGMFEDARWKNGTWDIQQFTNSGRVDWDAVIDAARRKWLEENPEASSNSDPVVFDTSTVPWWAWVKRFHLPEAEILNGRAAMIGYFAAYLIDSATGVGLVDQTNSFFGKLLLFIAVTGVLLIRKNEDANNLKTLASEWTFYDKQWQATWKNEEQHPVSEKEIKL